MSPEEGTERSGEDPRDPERALARLQTALQARDAFLRLATHELRGPLAAIQLQADTISLLVRQGASAGDIDGRAVRVTRLVQRLARQLEEVLDLARASSGRLALQPAETDLAAVIRAELERARDELARAGCDLRVTGPARLTARLDQARIEHAIGALLTALVRAGAGQAIEIELGQGDRARVELRGAGGVPEPQRSLAFASFEDAVRHGAPGQNALALWLARFVIEAHGGELALDDAGAVFELPVGGPDREKLAT